MVIRHLADASRSQANHFAGVGKMVSRFVPGLLARHLRAGDGILEAAPLAITQQWLKIACAPIFRTMLVFAFERLEVQRAIDGQLGGRS